MAEDFVQVTLPNWLRGSFFKAKILKWRKSALEASGKILDRESHTSVRERFYRTGLAESSLENQIVSVANENVLSYEEFSELYYFRFGEYGTGRRGEASGVPHPASYRYGTVAGMSARFMLGNALQVAAPQIVSEFQRFAKQLPNELKS